MRVACNDYGLGTWFQLRWICSVMMFPEHPMVRPDKVYLIAQEILCRAQFRIWGPKLVLYEGSFKKGLGRWGHTIGLEIRAHLGRGILVSYISPPLLHIWLPGRIKEPAEPFGLDSPMVRDSCGYGFSLMLFSKYMLFRGARFSCHYCLTVRKPKRRACRLSLAFAGSFVNHAHLLLD